MRRGIHYIQQRSKEKKTEQNGTTTLEQTIRQHNRPDEN